MSQQITIFYRNWRIDADDRSAVATKNDGSEERFECHKQPSFENALRTAKEKINRLEGPEVWNEEYQNEELKCPT